jgi:glutamate formiminotransferase
VVNVSEGRDLAVIGTIAGAGGDAVLDVHADADHHRSVITLAGSFGIVEESARAVVTAAVARIDIAAHDGVHPRLGAADVVPVVPLSSGAAAWAEAVDTRNRLAEWIGAELAVPCFLYGPERSLPDVRRSAFRGLDPDTGPSTPHPTAGATAVGVREPLIAYNLWLEALTPGDGMTGSDENAVDVTLVARDIAAEVRGSSVRALGLSVRGGAQVSCNLVGASGRDLEKVFDAVARGSNARGCRLARAEVVGLVPAAALDEIPHDRWPELGLTETLTIEARWTDAALRPAAQAPIEEPRGSNDADRPPG